MAAALPPAPLPVFILTGFLGGGKTTLLNRLLADPDLADSAVLINEFGEVGLDHLLVRTVDDGIVMLASGCVCCTIRGDLVNALEDLLRARDNNRIPPFSRVILETTGLADPSPIIQTLLAHPYFALRFRLAGVLTVVDAINGRDTLARFEEARRQVAVADRLILSKSELPEASNHADALKADIRSLNPAAPLLLAGEASVPSLFDGLSVWDSGHKSDIVRDWLSDAATDAHTAAAHHDAIRSFVLTSDRPVPGASFEMFSELLRATHGRHLLRVKGLVNLRERPDAPLLIQGAQHVWSRPEFLTEWPDDDRRTRLVFIVHDLPPNVVENLFGAFMGLVQHDRPDAAALADNPLAIPGLPPRR